MQQPAAINNPLSCLLFFLLIFFFPAGASGETAISAKQGSVVSLSITPGPGVDAIAGEYQGHAIPFFETEKGSYATLIGIDLAQKKGGHVFTVTWTQADKTGRQNYRLDVLPGAFGVQKLTLPKGKVDLDPPTLARVKKEQSLVKAAFDQSLSEKLWTGEFIVPVEGKKQGTFGRRRILNGQARNPHTGEDISAPEGTAIAAANHGKVVLVGNFFFNGHSVILDHGLGLFSMYFHLLDVSVAEGDRVKKGETIGRVGQSGRVTGPHLHWGMRLNGARIDPYELVTKKLD